MKLILSFITVFIMCVNPMHAQLQTNFFGCKLGVSSKKMLESVLKQRGLPLKENDDHNRIEGLYVIPNGVEFGGIVWDKAFIRFVNGKFASILFEKEASREETYNKLSSSLRKKYARYIYYSANPNSFFFMDKNTTADVNYFLDGKLILSYGCRRLLEDTFDSINESDL